MARNQPAFTWERGFKESAAMNTSPAWTDERYYVDDRDGTKAHYVPSEQSLKPTTKTQTDMGVEQLPGWPAVFDGTMGVDFTEHKVVMDGNDSSEDINQQKNKRLKEVDVLICGGK
jgi:phenol 2-monooxygenase